MIFTRLFIFLTLLCLTVNTVWAGPLDATFLAHGGVKNWDQQHGLTYQMKMKLGENTFEDQQTFDLKTRRGVITSAAYSIGYDGKDVWVQPNAKAIAAPPRFYFWTPFYFFGVPFVFNDSGVQFEELGLKPFEGKEYRAVKVTFASGIGDAPEDYYIHYADLETGLTKLVVYIVTYPAMRKGKETEPPQESVLIYDEWQTMDGLVVPKTGRFAYWKEDGRTIEQKGSLEFSEVRFSKTSPDATAFARPANAEVDRSHLPSQP